MNTFTCQNCPTVTEYTPIFIGERELFKPFMCPACRAKDHEERQQAAKDAKRAAMEEDWNRICPEAYRQTDPRFPTMDQRILAGLMRYEPTGDGRGIGLHGHTGQRKTRMLFLVLKKLHFAGVRVFAVSAKRLAGCYGIMYGKERSSDIARDIIRKTHSAEVLLLDDLGKEKFTEHGQAEFFDLIEGRTSRLKPILWTANASGSELESMMSEDRGAPIVRRLEDFTEVIGV